MILRLLYASCTPITVKNNLEPVVRKQKRAEARHTSGHNVQTLRHIPFRRETAIGNAHLQQQRNRRQAGIKNGFGFIGKRSEKKFTYTIKPVDRRAV
jgi:hypothetical protein